MKFFFLLLLFVFSTTLSAQHQELFQNCHIREVKWCDPYYVARVSSYSEERLAPLVRKKGTNPSLILFDKEGKLQGAISMKTGSLEDFQYRNGLFYCLESYREMTKVSSSVELYKTVYFPKGSQMERTLVSTLTADSPNARISGTFDDDGNCWIWNTWENAADAKVDFVGYHHAHKECLQIKCLDRKNNVLFEKLYTADELRLQATVTHKDRVVFCIEHRKLDGFDLRPGTLLLGIKDLEIWKEENLSRGRFYLKHIQLTDDGLFIGANYKGIDSINFELPGILRDKHLQTYPDDYAPYNQNSMIGFLNYDLDPQWITQIQSPDEMWFNSMHYGRDSIAVSIDAASIFVAEKEVKTKPNSGKDLILFFNAKGALLSAERPKDDEGYSDIEHIHLFPHHILYVGDFLNFVEFSGHRLEGFPKNSGEFLLFQPH